MKASAWTDSFQLKLLMIGCFMSQEEGTNLTFCRYRKISLHCILDVEVWGVWVELLQKIDNLCFPSFLFSLLWSIWAAHPLTSIAWTQRLKLLKAQLVECRLPRFLWNYSKLGDWMIKSLIYDIFWVQVS